MGGCLVVIAQGSEQLFDLSNVPPSHVGLLLILLLISFSLTVFFYRSSSKCGDENTSEHTTDTPDILSGSKSVEDNNEQTTSIPQVCSRTLCLCMSHFTYHMKVNKI